MNGEDTREPGTAVVEIGTTAVPTSISRPGGGALGLLRPIAPPDEILAVQNQTRAILAKTLVEGRDYGVIPGTGKADDKKRRTLLKPGAERINAAFGVVAKYRILTEEINHDRETQWEKQKSRWENGAKIHYIEASGISRGLYRYVVACDLYLGDRLVGQGIGSASTMESRYVDRPRDLENTVLKIAKKRAFVDGCLTTFGLSDEFTQDLEDYDDDEDDVARQQKKADQREKAATNVKSQVGEVEKRLAEIQENQKQAAAKRLRTEAEREETKAVYEEVAALWEQEGRAPADRQDDARAALIERGGNVERDENGVPVLGKLFPADMRLVLDHVVRRRAAKAEHKQATGTPSPATGDAAGPTAPAAPTGPVMAETVSCRKFEEKLHLIDSAKGDKKCIGCGTNLSGQRTAPATKDPAAYCQKALKVVDAMYNAEQVPSAVIEALLALGGT